MMKRRDLLARVALLAGLALASVDVRAQCAAPPPGESLYIPKPQLVEDGRFLHNFTANFYAWQSKA
jgi:hypothetical protein